ncbi:hypothetical protein GCM10010176_005200 [Nonomuraea spiralis]|nr:hypothetical protein GCM10010176_005200 [Nonomuraea spiralis]
MNALVAAEPLVRGGSAGPVRVICRTVTVHSPLPRPGVCEPGNGGFVVNSPDPRGCASLPHLLYVDHQLRITCCPMPGPSIIRLVGEVDATNQQALAETLGRARRIDEWLVLDVSELEFLGVEGARMLVVLCRAGRTRLVGTPPHVVRLFRAMGWAGGQGV